MKRSRGRSPRRQNPSNRSYDSNGPDVRVRGTPTQIVDKYQALARDAQSAGDRIKAENLLQHAEHYYRLLAANRASAEAAQSANGQPVAHGENSPPQTDSAVGETPEAAVIAPLVLPEASAGVSGFAEEGDADTDADVADKPKARRRGPYGRRRDGADASEDASDEA